MAQSVRIGEASVRYRSRARVVPGTPALTVGWVPGTDGLAAGPWSGNGAGRAGRPRALPVQRGVVVCTAYCVGSSLAGGQRYPAPRRSVSVCSQVMKRCSQLLGRRRGPPGICSVPDVDRSVSGIRGRRLRAYTRRRWRDLADEQVVAARRAQDLFDMLAHRVGGDHQDIAGARITDDGGQQHRPGQIGQHRG